MGALEFFEKLGMAAAVLNGEMSIERAIDILDPRIEEKDIDIDIKHAYDVKAAVILTNYARECLQKQKKGDK